MKKKMYKLIGILTILGLLSVFCIMSSAAESTGIESGKWYCIVNAATGKALNNNGNVYSNGNNVNQSTYTGTAQQQWWLKYESSSDSYKIYTGSGEQWKVLDIVKSGGSVVSGCNVEIWDETDPIAQQWKISYMSAGKYCIWPKANSNLALATYGTGNGTTSTGSTSNGNAFVTTYKANTNQQLWYIIPVGMPRPVPNGTYYIRNKKSGMFLDLLGGSTANSVETEQYTFHGATNQQWKLMFQNGVYKIKPVCAPGKALDVQGASTANNAKIQSYDDTRAIGQEWKLIDNGDGSFKIASRISNYQKCAVVNGASTAQSARIIQYQINNGWNEDWYFDRVDAANWPEETWTVPSGELLSRWTISAGKGSFTANFYKFYSANITYRSTPNLLMIKKIRMYTQMQQSYPVGDVGRVSTLNFLANVNGVNQTKLNCDCNGHIVGSTNGVGDAFSCNIFIPNKTGYIGSFSIRTEGYVHVPGVMGISAVSVGNDHECIYNLSM